MKRIASPVSKSALTLSTSLTVPSGEADYSPSRRSLLGIEGSITQVRRHCQIPRWVFADVKSLVLVVMAAKAGRGVWFRRWGNFAVPWSSCLLTFFIQQGTEYRRVPRWLASWGPRDGTFPFVLQGISLAHRRPITDVMPRVRYIRNPTSRLSM
jgi:hypothetical protein